MRIIILLLILFCLGWFGFQVHGQTVPEATAIVKNDPATNDPKATEKKLKDEAPTKTEAASKTDAAPKPDPTPTLRGALALAPEKAQPVRLVRFETPPAIDGNMGDGAWRQAAVFKNFLQNFPGDNSAPSQPTEVFMGYDAKNLYILFHAFDEPGKVRATVAKRDDVLNAEDSVRVLLDTFNDQRKAYVLCFNPFGVQQDGIRTEGVNVDFSVDIVMESKGALTEDGYVVEVAIPFKSLRYEAGKGKQWGIQIFRVIQRFNGEQDSWMPISRDVNGLLNQAGHITGLEGISTERTLELIPSLTVSETGKRLRRFGALPDDPADVGRMVNQPVAFDPGLTAKFTVTPTSTLNLAINPDFAQVEADATVVTTNQRFPIFFQEKRPFFLEGIDIFQLPLNVVHTRTIINPDVAVKYAGKTGRNTFGLMLASDSGPGDFIGDERLEPFNRPLIDKNALVGVLRLKRDIGRENSIGLVATTYNFLERHNHIAGLDGRFKLDPQTTFTFHLVGTTSHRYFREPTLAPTSDCAGLAGRELTFCNRRQVYRSGSGLGYYVQYEKAARRWYYNLLSYGRTRDFRADVGFTRRTNTTDNQLFIQYSTEPKQKARLVSWNISNFNRLQFDWQGRIQGWNSGGQVFFNFQRQSFIGFGYDQFYEKLYEEEFGAQRLPTRRNDAGDLLAAQTGAFFGRPTRSAYNPHFFFGGGTTPNKKFSGSLNVNLDYGAFDFDFGAGPNYPRVSSAALINPDAALDPGAGHAINLNGNFTYQPTNGLRMSLDYTKSRLTRNDTRLLAFDDNIYAFRATYQFTRFVSARARIDYDTLAANVRGQFLVGYAPNPGTAFYVGYNDDINRNGFNPFTGDLEQGFRRNGRTFFIKMSYLFQRSF